MVRVRKPVFWSTSWLNRASAYASGMLSAWPVAATWPAMPWPFGTRISAA